ncbi:MAG TPA: radical SAM protein, partial [bacterium]|nr:radical SAM protein [bacterium]
DPGKSVHQTMTAFGCPMACSFCMNALTDNHLRRRSVANVIEELLEAKRKNPGLRMVFFWDNIFQVNKAWCLEFAKEYKEKIDLPFFAYTHPFYVDEEVLAALRRAGWIFTVMGIQSGSRHIRKEIYGRNETNEQVLKAVRRLAALRKIKNPTGFFRIYLDYVKDNPLEMEPELHEGLDLMLQFPKNFIYQAFNLSFFPNYVITKVYLERGLITADDVAGRNTASGSNWITTFDKRKEYKGFLRLHEFYYLLGSLAQFRIFPNSIIRQIEKKRLFYNRLRLLNWICKTVRVIDLYTAPLNYVWLIALLFIVSPRMKLKHGTWLRHK